MSEKKFRQAAIAGMQPRQPHPPMTAEELDGPPWDGQYDPDGMPKPAASHNILPDLPWEERVTECGAIRQARKPGHQSATAHPWRHQKPGESEPDEPIHKSIGEDGEPQPRSSHDVGAWAPNWKGPAANRRNPIYFASFDARFDQPVSPVVQHVKDGRPLTERGAELLKGGDATAPNRESVTRGPHAAPAQPLPVVVSPSQNPPHSQQTKQVHQYQQRKQV